MTTAQSGRRLILMWAPLYVNKTVRIWTKESMQAYRIQDGSNTLEALHNTPNPIGIIPAICHYGRSGSVEAIRDDEQQE